MSIMDVFKDDVTSQWSLSRMSAALVVLMLLIYAGYVAFTTKTLPDAQSGWVSLILGLYVANKASSVITTNTGSK